MGLEAAGLLGAAGKEAGGKNQGAVAEGKTEHGEGGEALGAGGGGRAEDGKEDWAGAGRTDEGEGETDAVGAGDREFGGRWGQGQPDPAQQFQDHDPDQQTDAQGNVATIGKQDGSGQGGKEAQEAVGGGNPEHKAAGPDGGVSARSRLLGADVAQVHGQQPEDAGGEAGRQTPQEAH